MKRRATRTRPLLLASVGLAAVTYFGCEPEAIGNPKRPPDCRQDNTCDMAVIGNPKQPPDLSVVDGDRVDSGTD